MWCLWSDASAKSRARRRHILDQPKLGNGDGPIGFVALTLDQLVRCPNKVSRKQLIYMAYTIVPACGGVRQFDGLVCNTSSIMLLWLDETSVCYVEVSVAWTVNTTAGSCAFAVVSPPLLDFARSKNVASDAFNVSCASYSKSCWFGAMSMPSDPVLSSTSS